MGRLRRGAMWACVTVLAGVFVLVGTSKLRGPSAVRWSERFAQWGFPLRSQYLVGVLEVLGGLSLLIPKSRRVGAVTLIALMLGAVITHLVHAEPLRIAPPLILGGMVLIVSWWDTSRSSA